MNDDKAVLLWQLYGRLILFISRGFFSNDSEAEDAASESFFRVLKNIDRFDEPGDMRSKGLVIIITKNVCRDLKRRIVYTEELPEQLQSYEDISNIVVSEETVNEIKKCIAELPESYADILRLVYDYGMSDSEIAATLNISYQNARTRLSRARSYLMKLLKEKEIM